MSDNCLHVTLLIKMINEIVEREADMLLSEHNITNGQLRLLAELAGMENGEATLKEIEKQFSFSSAAISGVVSRLESKGLVESFTHPSDKRIKCVRILPEGNAICKIAIKSMAKFERQVLKDFSKEEKEQFKILLNKAYMNIGAKH